MKPVSCSLTFLAASFVLLTGSAVTVAQSGVKSGQVRTNPAYQIKPLQRTRQIRPSYKKPRTRRINTLNSIPNAAPSIARIRSEAIRESLVSLQRLRPYTVNYNELRSDVRRYWHRNVARPTTRGLAGTIMRHVKTFYKGFVRAEVYSGAQAGIRKVRTALGKRRR